MGRRPRAGRRWLRRLAISAIVIVLLGVALHLAADPFFTWRTRVILNGMANYRGEFGAVEVQLHKLQYRIRDLRIEKVSAAGAALPFFETEKAELGLYWKELLNGNVVAGVRLVKPKLNLLAAEKKEERQLEDAGKVGFQVGRLAPFRVDRLEVQGGEVLFVDGTEKTRPELWLHGIEATLENFATRKALSEGAPTVLALRGTLQRSGRVSIFATADPLAKALTFAGQARVDGLKVVELGELLIAKTGLSPKRGTLDVSARFQAENGRLRGGVRPVLTDPDVDQGKPGLGEKIKAGLVDLSLDLFSDDVPRRDGVATTIPIEGTLKSPTIEAMPTILGIVRNAFVVGLADSFSNLPLGEGHARGGEASSGDEPARSGDRQGRRAPPEKR